jgi:ADP-ribose pyrophosphatase YjhB (NUDIX family)
VIDESWYARPAGVIGERLTAGGVVVRIHTGVPLIALAREGDHVGPVLPKGGVEPGEELEQAARREIAEETGLCQLVLLGKLGVLERLSFDKRLWLTTHVFLFATDQATGIPTDGAHHQHGPVWRHLDDLDDLFWPDQRKLLQTHAERIRRARV